MDSTDPAASMWVMRDARVEHFATWTGPRLRTYALAAVASTVQELLSLDGRPEVLFLIRALESVDPAGLGWSTTLEEYLHDPAPDDLPLLALADELQLSLVELLTVSLAAAVEDDLMIGRALAYLQAPLGGSRPTLGLLAAAFWSVGTNAHHVLDALADGAAVHTGLLTLLGDTAPLPERSLSISLPLCMALSDRDGQWTGATVGLTPESRIPLPASLTYQAQLHADGLRTAHGRALVLRTASQTEGRAAAQAVALALGRRPVYIGTEHTHGMGPWLLLRRLLPVFVFDLAPGERKVLPTMAGYAGPVLGLSGPDGNVENVAGTVINWSLPVPSRRERQELWSLAVGNEALAGELARYHRHSTGRISHLGRLAHHHSAVRGRAAPSMDDIVAASWTDEGAGLDALAQPMTALISDEALVMAPALRVEMEGLLARCRTRDGLVEGLGAAAVARYYTGVRALFVGPSGTGKTLGAGWLATRLGLPLYRVDLASVTSKYIGETEKNLAQLLARAEQAEVVLLFDEADSLFGKRTDVREANDRFANAQTNYLLQRIESFDGITILTSNSRSRFDSAFSRRLDTIVEFPIPGPEERRSLWQSHLGAHHTVTQTDLNQLAATADICGGNIRNAVLAAAVSAQSEDRSIEIRDVVRGLEGEYRKLERHLPTELKLHVHRG